MVAQSVPSLAAGLNRIDRLRRITYVEMRVLPCLVCIAAYVQHFGYP